MKHLRFFLFTTFVCIFGILLSSCSEDEGYSLGDIWITKYATINNVGGPIRSFTIEDSIVLTVVASDLPFYIPKEPRATISYTILGDQENGHLIKLNGIAEIPTYKIHDIEEEALKELVNSPIEYDSLTISDQYINLDFSFQYGGDSNAHSFEMYRIINDKNITSDELQLSDDFVNLELIHNKNEDTDKWLRTSSRCFDLRSLRLPKGKEVTLIIKINTMEGYKYVVYDYTPY